MGIELDPRWQEEAYEQVKRDFEEGNRSCIIAPTGSGKSAIAVKLFEENPNKEILYVSSSSVINQQIKKRVQEIYGKPFHKVFPNVKFKTYNALSKMPTEEYSAINPEIVVYDEIHRAGAEIWQIRAKELLKKNKDVKLLGMTATPIRTDGRNMAEELCGRVSYELKLTEAVARGILPVPIYVNARYLFNEDMQMLKEKINSIEDSKERLKLRRRYDKWFERAKNNLGEAQGVPKLLEKYKRYIGDKCIIFCKNTEHIDEIAELCEGKEGWFSKVNLNVKTIKISYLNEREENLQSLEFFRRNGKEKMKVALVCEKLNEGYHDEELTTGILARPTKSEILFRQQLGRLLTRDGIRQPIIFDLVGNMRHFQEFRREVEEIVKGGIAQGEKNQYDRNILEQFKIMDEELEFIKEFEEIESKVNLLKGKTTIEKLLDICEILKANGTDFTKIQLARRVNGKTVHTTIEDVISEQGIDKKILRKYKLNKDYKIGIQIRMLRQSYKNIGSCTITEEDRTRAEGIKGLLSGEEKTAVQEILDICEILQGEGVDFTKVKTRKTVNRKSVATTIENIIEEQGIDTEALKEYDLDKGYKIGQKISMIRNVFRGTVGCIMTEEDRLRAKAINGLIMEKGKTAIEELLDICEILRANGVDFTKTTFSKTTNRKTRYKTLGDILEEQSIDDVVIGRYNLDKNYEIGKKIDGLRRANKGTTSYKMTEKDKARAKVIEGILPKEEKTAIEELLDICEILKEKGVDFTKLQLTTTIKGNTRYNTLRDILLEQGIGAKFLEESGLDANYKIGVQIMGLRQSINGTGSYTITGIDKTRAKAIEGLMPKERTSIQELLDICEILRASGVDFTKIQLGRIVDGKKISTTIEDIIKEQEIDADFLEKCRLNKDYKIGRLIEGLRKAYKGKRKVGYAITEADKTRAKRIEGLIPEEKTVTQELLRICKILKENSVDFTKVKVSKMVDGIQMDTVLENIIQQQGIDTAILEKNDLNANYDIGYQISSLRYSYKGKGKNAVTEEEKDEAEILGLIPKLAIMERQKQKLLKQQQEAKELRDEAKDILELGKSDIIRNEDK